MIKSAHVVNFQSWKDVLLEFSSGVNAIIGPSDNGKTALLRLIEWIARNRPLGDAFRSNWGGDTLGELILENEGDKQFFIQRLKTDKLNQYTLAFYLPNLLKDKQTFNAIKQDVPEEIQKALNINEINLQQQLDQHFLLANSPGEVGAHFNRIANLDVIDIGNQNVQKWIRSIEQDIRSGEQYLKEQQEELKKYEHLDSLEQKVQVLETLDEQRQSSAQKVSKLKKLITDLDNVKTEIDQKLPLLSLELKVDAVLNLFDKMNEQEKECEELRDFIFQFEKTDEAYEENKSHLTKIEKEFYDVFPDICPLCGQEVRNARQNKTI